MNRPKIVLRCILCVEVISREFLCLELQTYLATEYGDLNELTRELFQVASVYKVELICQLN
jgi:hypothetical protein